MYDMYPWNDRAGARLPAPRDGRDPVAARAPEPAGAPGPAEAPDHPEAGPAAEAKPAEAMQAVQVALDRRDNGATR